MIAWLSQLHPVTLIGIGMLLMILLPIAVLLLKLLLDATVLKSYNKRKEQELFMKVLWWR